MTVTQKRSLPLPSCGFGLPSLGNFHVGAPGLFALCLTILPRDSCETVTADTVTDTMERQ